MIQPVDDFLYEQCVLPAIRVCQIEMRERRREVAPELGELPQRERGAVKARFGVQSDARNRRARGLGRPPVELILCQWISPGPAPPA